MNSFKKAAGQGVLLWLVLFITGFALFPLHESNRIFFETLMPIILVITTLILGLNHLKKSRSPQKEGLKIGLIWLAINLIIDAILFLSPTPMQMGITEYLQDIGLIYLIIPIITSGLGKAMTQRIKTFT